MGLIFKLFCFPTEVRDSRTKPCGSKRKQDELDDDEEEEEDHQTWVQALSRELTEEDPEEDPDYEVSRPGGQQVPQISMLCCLHFS